MKHSVLTCIYLIAMTMFYIHCAPISLCWGKGKAIRGEEVELKVENLDKTIHNATLTIYLMQQNRSKIMDTSFTVDLCPNMTLGKWLCNYKWDVDSIPTEEEMQKIGKHCEYPMFYFTVKKGTRKWKSDNLIFLDYLEIELKDSDGYPFEGEKFIIFLPDGTTQQGRLNENGYAKISGIPPGKILLKYPDGVDIIQSNGD